MLAAVLKLRLPLVALVLPPLAVILFFTVNGWKGRHPVSVSASRVEPRLSVEQMKKSLAKDRELLAAYEREQASLRAEVIKRRKLFLEHRISKDQVTSAENSFVAAARRVYRLRDSVNEMDIAITEAVLGEKVLRMPVLPVGGYSQTADLMRFNGGFRWSIKEAQRIEKFFSQTFGRSLPITALGQSRTHDRLGFDHRDSLDVGLHPDSPEGRQLIEYLRQAGIPFLAFRQAIPGASTGPHIHIGKPSARLVS